MPYIDSKHRQRLDPAIDDLADRIIELSQGAGRDAAFAGLLNYSCSRLALRIIKQRFGRVRYWLIATVCGVFKNVADEFYRRVGGPYEDGKILEAGDLEDIETILGSDRAE